MKKRNKSALAEPLGGIPEGFYYGELFAGKESHKRAAAGAYIGNSFFHSVSVCGGDTVPAPEHRVAPGGCGRPPYCFCAIFSRLILEYAHRSVYKHGAGLLDNPAIEHDGFMADIGEKHIARKVFHPELFSFIIGRICKIRRQDYFIREFFENAFCDRYKLRQVVPVNKLG